MDCEKYLNGKPVSEGFAIGHIFVYHPFEPVISGDTLKPEETPDARARYTRLKAAAKAELEEIHALLSDNTPEKAKIFAAHQDILFDDEIDGEILCAIDGGEPVDRAVNNVYTAFIGMLSINKNPLIRERADDLRDVRNRLLRINAGVPEQNLSNLIRPMIVAARDLLPSDTATLDRKNTLAIVTEVGGETSHSAIIAKSYGIPAVLGISDLMSELAQMERSSAQNSGISQSGQSGFAIVDTSAGMMILNPLQKTITEYEIRSVEYKKAAGVLWLWREKSPVTADGVRIEVMLNIAAATQEELAVAGYADGIGLFRTEFLYMGRNSLPTEDEQYNIYRKVLEVFGKKPVTLRTLDIGGDKQLDCLDLPREENPFLGNRALRLCLSRPDVFNTQLRAALRAGLHGNLRIMFPMVGSIDDILSAKQAVAEAAHSLKAEGIPFDENVKLGIMIEVPSIALMADEAVQLVDFASIGTNDLCQYLLAADRMNPAVADYYQSYHPAMFRLISIVAETFTHAGKELCVCGELGGDALAGPLLIGLGLRSLSMGASSLGRCKKTICGLTIERAENIAHEVLRLNTERNIKSFLAETLEVI
jgi:phosphotransferase system enzyme I (PtsI)